MSWRGKMPEELKVIQEILELNKIPYEERHHIDEPYSLYRLHFVYKGNKWSVVSGYGSYGGNKGLLEIMRLGQVESEELYPANDEPIGWLTAEEVMLMIFGGGYFKQYV